MSDPRVVVVTGASSGIGRATAAAFAARGAAVVLAARRDAPLAATAREVRQRGGRALDVPTDVADPDAVTRLAAAAVNAFGRVDVWVNNAAVAAFGRFEATPPEIFRRVIETNLLGYAHGARAVLPYFREQRSGVLINVASILGRYGVPYTSAYTAAKFGIVGLSEVLRQEWRSLGLHVVTVLPASIDTPLYRHAANFTGRVVRPVRPVYRAERVAEAIVECADDPERERWVGASGPALNALRRVAPAVFDRATPITTDWDMFEREPEPPTTGNVMAPIPTGTSVSGGWRARTGRGGRWLAGAVVTATAAAWLLLPGRRGPARGVRRAA